MEVPPTSNQQQNTSQEALVAGLAALLNGVEPADLLLALESVKAAKESTQPAEKGRSIYQEKETIYDDESAFIYRRGDTKSKGYYYAFTTTTPRHPLSRDYGLPTVSRRLQKHGLSTRKSKVRFPGGNALKALPALNL